MAIPAGWMKTAVMQANKPKQSIIGVLRKNIAGMRPGRSHDTLHASDITKPNFCPRKWAFFDLQSKKSEPEYLCTALAITYDMGNAAEQLLVNEWAGDAVVGDWECLRCGKYRSMCSKPVAACPCGNAAMWKYRQITVESIEYKVSGSMDCLFDVGAPKLSITEIKTMNPTEFDGLAAPLPEHRLRTSLYMKLVADSANAHKDRLNLHEARVLYLSRAYGKKNPDWDEILPLKEYIVKRDDIAIGLCLKKAKQLQIFREQSLMPSGICTTILDKPAKNCDVCKACFSGDYFSQQEAL